MDGLNYQFVNPDLLEGWELIKFFWENFFFLRLNSLSMLTYKQIFFAGISGVIVFSFSCVLLRSIYSVLQRLTSEDYIYRRKMIFAGDDEKLISEIKARAQLRKFADDAMQDGIVISRAGTSAAKQAGDARNKDETDLTHADQVQEDELIGNMRPAEVRRIERDLLRGKLKLDKLTPEESAVVTRMERELKERTEQSKLTEKRLSADKSQTEKKLLMARKAEDAKEQQRIREEKKQEALKAASTASAMDLDVQKLYAVNPEGAINPNSPERLKVMLEKTQEQLIEESLLTVRLENRKRHTDDQQQSFDAVQLELLARQREAAAKLAQDQRDAAALTAQMQRDEQVSVLREMERRHEELRRNDEVRQEQELLYAKHLDEQRLAESRRLDLQAEEEKRRART